MSQLIVFIVGIMVGAGVVWFWLAKIQKGGEKEMPELIRRQAEKKQQHKQKILKLLEKKGKIVNDDVEKLLGVSDKTAQRYFNELQSEGKIKQIGETGKGVHYTKP